MGTSSHMIPSGSSPLARGLLVLTGPDGREHRIIPARAGFTNPHRGVSPHGVDHPRSRGVYQATERRTRRPSGSSPLARGLRDRRRAGRRMRGIIPARAGFTRSPPSWAADARDHPRSRGVYRFAPAAAMTADGSSPLARGLHHTGTSPKRQIGIIPARAGFTQTAGSPGDRTQDHPRSRGVYGNSKR